MGFIAYFYCIFVLLIYNIDPANIGKIKLKA